MMIMVQILCVLLIWVAHGSADPTQGFTQLNLSAANFDIQKPYDKEVSERYNFTDGVHSMWVYSDDKPHDPNSNTKPRTEIRIKEYDYTAGVRQLEGDFYVPRGTSGTCIMQVFGASEMGHATALQLRVYDGQLKHYEDDVVVSDVYDRWIHFNVIHDADEGKVHVFIDGEEKVVADDRGRANHYFKCGVYSQDNSSHFMESLWKNIKVWTKLRKSFIFWIENG